MTAGPAFARCVRCGTLCGVVHEGRARAGGWLPALGRACRCGAGATRLVPATEGEVRRLLASGVAPPVRVVPDGWPRR